MKSSKEKTKEEAIKAEKPKKAEKKAEKARIAKVKAAQKTKTTAERNSVCGNVSSSFEHDGADFNDAGKNIASNTVCNNVAGRNMGLGDSAVGDIAGGAVTFLSGSVPKHVAIIMDGNGRWAKARHLPRQMGHKEGVAAIEVVADAARKQGVEYLSFFAFSTENWRRPKQEVHSLMNLLKTRLPKIAKRLKTMGCQLVFSGDFSVFDSELRDIIFSAEVLTRDVDNKVLDSYVGKVGNNHTAKPSEKSGRSSAAVHGDRNKCMDGACGGEGSRGKKCVINICLNYGGRQEIVNAANRAIEGGKHVDEHQFSRLLYTGNLPDPDLLIRTGGERRLSNFLLFQVAYTELYFCDKLWPDFGEKDLLLALKDYQMRNRRFGGV